MTDWRTDGQIENGDFMELLYNGGPTLQKKPWIDMVDYGLHETGVLKIARIYGLPKSQISDININN